MRISEDKLIEELHEALVASNRRELELLAVIEIQLQEIAELSGYNVAELPYWKLPSFKALREHEAKVLEELAIKWLPYRKRTDWASSINQTLHNLAIDDCIKCALEMADERRKK